MFGTAFIFIQKKEKVVQSILHSVQKDRRTADLILYYYNINRLHGQNPFCNADSILYVC